jgi:chorismate mutase-like protein
MTPEDGLKVLAECRVRIDELDRRIIDLLSERTRIVEEIGRVKQHLSLPIYEPRREDDVFENVTRHNPGPLSADSVKRVFERIIDEMRTIQRLRMLEKDGTPPTPRRNPPC